MAEYYKVFNNSDRVLPVPDEVVQRNMKYLATSDELFSWFEDRYERTDNPKDVLKLKDIHDDFINSDYFMNLNKNQKRANNKKHFVEKLQNNMFLKKMIKTDGHNALIITNYRIIRDDAYGEDKLDM